MKKDLCIDARMLFSSGIGTYLRNTIPYLVEDISTTLIIKKEDEKAVRKWFSGDVIFMDASIYTAKEQGSFPLKVPVSEVFWSPHYNIPLLPIRAKKRVVTIHDVCHFAAREFFPFRKRVLASFLLKQAVKKSSLILTGSRFSLEEITRILPYSKDKIHSIPYGVERRSKEDSTIEQKRPFVLYVGNLKPHKNIERLVEGFLRLPSEYDLILAGQSSFKGQPWKENPRIRSLGVVSEEDLGFLYSKASLLVQPSFYEGFGLTPLEAMHLGCPVVVSKIGGLMEACGEAAFYIDPFSTDSLYHGMLAVLTSKGVRDSLIAKGREREKLFSWEKSAMQIKELLQKEIAL